MLHLAEKLSGHLQTKHTMDQTEAGACQFPRAAHPFSIVWKVEMARALSSVCFTWQRTFPDTCRQSTRWIKSRLALANSLGRHIRFRLFGRMKRLKPYPQMAQALSSIWSAWQRTLPGICRQSTRWCRTTGPSRTRPSLRPSRTSPRRPSSPR